MLAALGLGLRCDRIIGVRVIITARFAFWLRVRVSVRVGLGLGLGLGLGYDTILEVFE